MPNKFKYHIEPNSPDRPRTACILRRDHGRARRAWAIFIRCPDVNWRDKWLWGLYFLTEGASPEDEQRPSAYSQQERGVEAERYLRSLQVSAHESDKPAVLAQLVLHLIKVERYRAALEELDTYLVSYPYLLSASLHTYAGLLSFYLAQPVALRAAPTQEKQADDQESRESSVVSDMTDTTNSTADGTASQPNAHQIRQAREWFAKALVIDPNQSVAREFVNLIDNPSGKSPLTEDMDLDSVTEIAELSVRDDESDEEGGYDDHGSREDEDDFKDDDTDDRSDYKSDEGDGYATDEGILGLRR